MFTNRSRTIHNRSTTYHRDRRVHWTGEIYDTKTAVNVTGVWRRIKDVNHPGFESIRKSGGVVLGDVELRRITRSYSPGSLTYPPNYLYRDPQWAEREISGDLASYYLELLAGGASISPTKTGWAAESCLVKAFAKMNESSLLLGESLADFGATVGMLARPFSGATKLLQQMMKRRARLSKKTAKSIALATSNSWLEYRYGWRPLLMDIETIVKESTQKRVACERPRLVVRSGMTLSDSQSGEIPTQCMDGTGYRLSWKGKWSSSVEQKISAGVIYSIRNNTGQGFLDDIMGSRARDVVPTLWEILPYSFVVDWFVGVGDWLQAVSPDPKIVILGNWSTNVQTSITSCSGDAIEVYHGGTEMLGTLGSSRREIFDYVRTCNNQLPNMPVRKFKLSSLNQVDGVSLALKPLLGLLEGMRH